MYINYNYKYYSYLFHSLIIVAFFVQYLDYDKKIYIYINYIIL